MNLATWLRIGAILLGTLALALLVWFGAPFLAVGEVRPFESVWVRLPLVVLLALGALAWIAVIVIRRRRATAALTEALEQQQESTGDAAALSGAMHDALATLRRARGTKGGDYLYDLPWYVIIGPPGAGKTTALVNSGLKFPLARGGATPAAIAGVGGTRYCDWWFAEEAVLIDTAGRYTTQDTDTKAEKASWFAFLDLLKANRPRQPINGVMVAISVEDLLTSSPEEIAAHADAIRSRLLELNERLKVDFPVYAVFTKSDLIAGFNEFFGSLSEPQRRMVWGHSFQTTDKTRNMIGDVAPEYDALIERLNERLPDRLQDEANPTARAQIFGFPSQMATLKRSIVDFLGRVFEPTRYHANATLRGFYFTSGTQEGTPIDQLIGALSRNFGSDHASAGAYSGRGKSYFLTDLIQKVIIGEAGWVSTDLGAARRTTMLRVAGFATVAIVSLVALGLWWMSFSRNSDLITATNYGLSDYRSSAAPVLQETTISDRNFSRVLPLLHKLRHMPAGYATREEPTPVSATFGLSQRDRLQTATEITYQQALERMLRSRIIFRLEEQLEANQNNPGFVYEALKVYMMVGGQAKLDRDLVTAWMRLDWAENLFPGAANAKGREALEEHLVAMLDLDDGDTEPLVKLNQSLIENSQRTLRRLSIAERAYELLRTQARAQSQKDWVAARRGGSDVRLAFEGVAGEDLDAIRVPYFYTYDGFQNAFVDRLGDIGDRIEKERWVLGENVDQQAIIAQYATLFQDLLKLYSRDYVAAWQRTLARLKLRPLNADKPQYVALSAMAAPTSPFKQILESVRDETQLTKERPSAKKAAAQAATDALEKRASDALSRLGTNLPLSAPGVERVLGGGGNEALGADIESQFKPFHVLVEGDLGRRPVDQLLQILAEINQNLAIAATNPAQSAAANAALVPLIASLRANSSRYPAPFGAMVVSAVNDFEGDATGATVALLRQALGDQVSRVCTEILSNRYPFVKASARDVPLADFARLFAPGGIMDKFYKERLEPYVDSSKAQWNWRVESRVARALSPTTLREFQRASEIKEAFFPTGGNLPSFQMIVVPTALSADAASAKLEINGFTVQSQQGVNTPAPVMWPGAGIGRTAITLTLGGGSAGGAFGGGFFSSGPSAPSGEVKLFEKDGVWSFFRLLDAGSVLKQGDNVGLTLAAGGRQVGYSFGVGSLKNPLILPALREIRCPTGI
ncbi:MAG TPA: type VI secretion system membrane subunit TssM [Bosea sp. (in: a-proteobacteria)]|jgi:type VI secretion system protein ImpL|uniref:type VI secretion system membrane subunit TssM n=1 Tax=Bosea sp. (in: a-proteobacteria) TaxID=1871050 RepID=UPI002E14C31F|nr:type VI secretion system membrane subunit TssM [Bosea sp. (in: a-proteobacteria)]